MTTTLVILAAGVGSRYGGLKQLDPVGPGGAALMDYTMWDARNNGYDRVVLVVRRETEAEIKTHIDAGAGRHLEVHYAYQELGALPAGYSLPADRVKPWGTGQAVLAAADRLVGPFVVANADDFYGGAAVGSLATFLAESSTRLGASWAMVGYRLADTLPENGIVSRALCLQNDDGLLTGLEELLAVQRSGEGAVSTDDRGQRQSLSLDRLVSMNLWGFTPALLDHLTRGFETFLDGGPGPKDEYYLPVAVADAIAAGDATVRVLASGGQWCGMTSPEDRAVTATVLRGLVDKGIYPERLWE